MDGGDATYPRCLFVLSVLLGLCGPRARGYLWTHKHISAISAWNQKPGVAQTPLRVIYLGSLEVHDLLWEQDRKPSATKGREWGGLSNAR